MRLILDEDGIAVESTGRVRQGNFKEKPVLFPLFHAISARAGHRGGHEVESAAEPAINMKTMKALGLTVPPSLLLRAEEVIQ